MTTKARPHGAQEYKGNRNHDWEYVAPNTDRLRVPGGWLYRTIYGGEVAMSFVPTPDVVGYAI